MSMRTPLHSVLLSLFLSIPGCGGGGGGPPSDNQKPAIQNFRSDKPQYDLGEDVVFSGTARDDAKLESTWMDVDGDADSNNDGNPSNDRDLPGLNATLVGGYPILPGKYTVRGWAMDTSGNRASSAIYPIVKPHPQFAEVQDEPEGLSSFPDILTRSYTFQDWELEFYANLSTEARQELDRIENLLRSSAFENPETVQVTFNVPSRQGGLIYGVQILVPESFRGFTEDYAGHYPLSSATFEEIRALLSPDPPGLPIEYWGLAFKFGGPVPDGLAVTAWIDINGDRAYQSSGAKSWDGDEDFNAGGILTQQGWYISLIPADNPNTLLVEGYDPAHPSRNTMSIRMEGNTYIPPDLWLLNPGSYRQHIWFE